MCTYDGELTLQAVFDGELGFGSGGAEYDEYTGQTEVTPSENEQILLTSEKVVLENIKINPIPSDWGKITWNGAFILVS